MPPISIAEAFERILAHVRKASPSRLPLLNSLGHYLAEDIVADRDFPPFHRSMVDGYAVFASDTRAAPDVLEVIEEVPAGKQAQRAIAPGQTIKIMTGAPLPPGANAVIMREQTAPANGGFVRVEATVRENQNVARQATDCRSGESVLRAGVKIGPGEIGILAAIGCVDVPVRSLPEAAILGTGDEIIEPERKPGPSQIRNSNSYQLLAQCAANHISTRYLGIAPDDPVRTRALIEDGLRSGLFISTGGVSVGDHDYVGSSFQNLGVEIFFDKVAIKPGKPTTFGVMRRASDDTLVFGLPGNPVAAWVCFNLFVTTAVRARCGVPNPLPKWYSLPLAGNAPAPGGDRLTFRPCRLVNQSGQTQVQPVEWHGSGHLTALSGVDGIYAQPATTGMEQGTRVTFYPAL